MNNDLRNRVARAIAKYHTLPWEGMPDARKSRLLAYADAALAEMGGVRVKPLEWRAYNEIGHGRCHYGSGVFGHWYAVSRSAKARWFCSTHHAGKVRNLGYFHTLEAAKAAAQADYEARILAAIEPAPVSTEQQSATDYCYNRNDWEITFEWDDRDMLVEHMMPGEVMEVGTLQQGPTLWVAEYENGDGDRETRWFDNEADARAIAEGKDDD